MTNDKADDRYSSVNIAGREQLVMLHWSKLLARLNGRHRTEKVRHWLHYTHLSAFFFLELPGQASTKKLNRSIFSKQEMGGSSISWTICKSFAPHYTHTHTHLQTCRQHLVMNEECVAVDAVGSMPKLQPRVDRQVCAVRFLIWEDVAPRRPTSPTKHTQNPMAGKIRDDWWVRPSHGECRRSAWRG